MGRTVIFIFVVIVACAAMFAVLAQPMLTRIHLVKVRKKILLINRDARVTRVVRQSLETAGKYSIREEHDAAFAFHVAHWFRPDLILIDLTTAATDGSIIARRLQNDIELCEVPLLCLNNFVSDRQFMSAGILRGYSFLAVPVKIEQLLHAVEHLLFGTE